MSTTSISAQEKTVQYKQFTPDLSGSWNWDSTKTCQRANLPVSSPNSVNFSKKYTFENHLITEYRNDSIIHSSSFSIIESSDMNYSLRSTLLKGVITIANEKIVISTCFKDGTKIYLSKIMED